MSTGPRTSQKDLVLSELDEFQGCLGRPEPVVGFHTGVTRCVMFMNFEQALDVDWDPRATAPTPDVVQDDLPTFFGVRVNRTAAQQTAADRAESPAGARSLSFPNPLSTAVGQVPGSEPVLSVGRLRAGRRRAPGVAEERHGRRRDL